MDSKHGRSLAYMPVVDAHVAVLVEEQSFYKTPSVGGWPRAKVPALGARVDAICTDHARTFHRSSPDGTCVCAAWSGAH